MEFTAVWLSLSQAKLFQIRPEEMRKHSFQAARRYHHTHRINDDPADSEEMFERIAGSLGSSDKIVVLGEEPATAQFMSSLTRHHPKIANRVVACEASDPPTDPQVAHYAKRFLRVV